MLGQYEHNGYDDSDFYGIIYRPDRHTVTCEEIGSTRYAGRHFPGWVGCDYVRATPAIEQRALPLLVLRILAILTATEHNKVLEPEPRNLTHGLRVRVTADSSPRARKNHYKAGMAGEVFWFGQFGTFYAKGYKKPGRHNTSVGIVMDGKGDKVFVPLDKLRLDRDPMPDTELRTRAEDLAQDRAWCSWFCSTSGVNML